LQRLFEVRTGFRENLGTELGFLRWLPWVLEPA
jgi:hypothetical protein